MIRTAPFDFVVEGRSTDLAKCTSVRGRASSSSIETRRALATLIRLRSEGFPDPDSMCDTVERGSPESEDKSAWDRFLARRRLNMFRDRWPGTMADSLSIRQYISDSNNTLQFGHVGQNMFVLAVPSEIR